MTIKRFTAQGFRCLDKLGFEPDPEYTLVYGANASGKTSLLEAIAYLGRGKSFRGAPPANLIQHGQQAFDIGKVQAGSRLVEQIQCMTCSGLAKFGGQLYSLGLSAGKGSRGLT